MNTIKQYWYDGSGVIVIIYEFEKSKDYSTIRVIKVDNDKSEVEYRRGSMSMTDLKTFRDKLSMLISQYEDLL